MKWLRFKIDQFLLSFWHRPSGQIHKKKKVGILRLDGMGDLILFLDALKGYRSFYPGDEYDIFLIVEHWALSVLRDNNDFDNAFPLDTRKFKKNIFYRWKILKEIRSMGLDIFINGCIFRELLYGDILSFASGAKERYGFVPQPDQMGERVFGDSCYTNLFSDPKWKVHELERNGELVRQIGHKHFIVGMPSIKTKFPLEGNKKEFIIVPGARFKTRRWPARRFARLAEKIYQRTGLTPIITGSVDERYLAEELIKECPDIPWKNRMGSPIGELPELLSSASFILTNDTGIMHFGMALGVKTAAIVFGGLFTQYSNYPRYLQKHFLVIHDTKTDCFDCLGNCIYSNERDKIKPCLENITVDQVYRAIKIWFPVEGPGAH
ncbi:MAG TPA: glycosyltransferase family 9 protein [Nitrospiria bacterium]|nr:glycosyltransferase family 9 protein [Nitrospiria bacterium]